MLAFGGTACLSALRAILPGIGPLLLVSFLAGGSFAVWAVSIAPAVAGLVTEQRRARAFSILFSTGILLGIPAGWVAGRLPEWMGKGKQGALLAACLVAASALIPASRLSIAAQPARVSATYPKGRFVTRFLFAFALWHLATGAFNPFFNAYFATRHHAGTQAIGAAFSIAQAVQIFTLLGAPIALRKLGLARGVASMMAATAVGLVLLAVAPNYLAAVMAYAAYMGFEFMSEPGINTLLMNHVSPEQRAGASSLYYLTAFCAQACAAAGAGAWVARDGFVPTLVTASVLSVAAAFMIRKLATEPLLHGAALPDPRSIPESA
jgi:predicted MFS family arabinose efflux permease